MASAIGRLSAFAIATATLSISTIPAARAQVAPATELDPTAPLAPMPDLGVDWPDLSAQPDDPATAAATMTDVGDARYDWKVEGIDGIGSALFRQRFDELSVLKANAGKPANAAQIDRRAREDAELMTTLLRAEGYYDARVATRVAPEGQRLLVTIDVEPGALYKFEGVTLDAEAAAAIQAALEACAARARAADDAYEQGGEDAADAAEEDPAVPFFRSGEFYRGELVSLEDDDEILPFAEAEPDWTRTGAEMPEALARLKDEEERRARG